MSRRSSGARALPALPDVNGSVAVGPSPILTTPKVHPSPGQDVPATLSKPKDPSWEAKAWRVLAYLWTLIDVVIIPVADTATNIAFLVILYLPSYLNCINYVCHYRRSASDHKPAFPAIYGSTLLALAWICALLSTIDIALLIIRFVQYYRASSIKPCIRYQCKPVNWLVDLIKNFEAFVECEKEEVENLTKWGFVRCQDFFIATSADTIEIFMSVSYLYYTGSGSKVATLGIISSAIALIKAWSHEFAWLLWSAARALCKIPRLGTTPSLKGNPTSGPPAATPQPEELKPAGHTRKVPGQSLLLRAVSHEAFTHWQQTVALLLVIVTVLGLSVGSFGPGIIMGAGITYLKGMNSTLTITCAPLNGGAPISYNTTFTPSSAAMASYEGMVFYYDTTSDSGMFPDLGIADMQGQGKMLTFLTDPLLAYGNSTNPPSSIYGMRLRMITRVKGLEIAAKAYLPAQRVRASAADMQTFSMIFKYQIYDIWQHLNITKFDSPGWNVLCPPSKSTSSATIAISETPLKGKPFVVTAFDAPKGGVKLGKLLSIGAHVQMTGQYCDNPRAGAGT